MAKQKKNGVSLWQEFSKGIVKQNPVLRLVLGTCPTLAITTAASNAIGMGLAATLVLVCSNAAISALRNVSEVFMRGARIERPRIRHIAALDRELDALMESLEG